MRDGKKLILRNSELIGSPTRGDFVVGESVHSLVMMGLDAFEFVIFWHKDVHVNIASPVCYSL